MTAGSAVLCCIFTSFAVHYGWRMRGTVIGGEKGAMLPGLLAGLVISQFAGDSISKLFFIPAAAGLIGMSYGGIEPYGDSISLVMDKRAVEPNPKKGLAGLALKGALWFSIAGGYIGFSFSAMGSKYSVGDIIAFCILVPIAQLAGYRIFNQPYDPENGKLPKIYLSYESRDEWGSNVGVLFVILLFAIIRKDVPALSMCLCGLVFGAVGWLVAMRLYYYTEHRMKNGKYLLGVFSEKGLVGGWSNMEFCLGSFGGFGLALGFVLARKSIGEINAKISTEGVFSPISNNIGIYIFMAVLFIALLVINVYEYRCDRDDRYYNSFIMDCIERPFFNTLPYAAVLMCSVPAAKLMTVFMLLYVLLIKCSFDRLKPGTARKVFIAVGGLICLAAAVCCVLINGFETYWLLAALIAGTVPYILSELYWCIATNRHGGWECLSSLNGFSFGILLMTADSAVIIVVAYLLKIR